MTDIQEHLNIIQVSTADIGGGAESSAWNLFKYYQLMGHNSWLSVGHKFTDDQNVLEIPNNKCCNRWAKMWCGFADLIAPLSKQTREGNHLRGVLSAIANHGKWIRKQKGCEDFDFPGTWKLLQLTAQPPHIIHCHNLHGQYFDLRVLPWLSHQVPVILNLRDAWLLSGHCAHSFNCQKWKTGCNQCPDLNIYPSIKRDAAYLNWRRKSQIYQRSRLYITTPSYWLMTKVQQSMLNGFEYKVIPNSVDTKIFCLGDRTLARTKLGLPADAKILLFVANCISNNPWKDYDTIYTVVQQIVSKRTYDKIVLLCLGARSEQDKTAKNYIRFIPFKYDPKIVAEYYRAADICIHAAKEETFGKVVAEAMSCGTPVVATAVGGIPEQIKNGITGLLVPPGKTRDMAAAINRLLDDRPLRLQMGKSAEIDAHKRFSLEHQAMSFLDWYEEILQDWLEKGKSALSSNKRVACAAKS